MMRQIALTAMMVSVVALTGCVSSGTYKIKEQEANNLNQELSDLKQKYGQLQSDHATLETEFKNKNDLLGQAMSQQQAIDKQNAHLRDTISNLQRDKDAEAQKSQTYASLVDKMKNEISQGQVTISELQGKLTLNMLDAVLFDSGQAQIKADGLAVLQKVVEILKSAQDKNIRIEGHTDNAAIKTTLAKKYPTNWELSAARALNVTKYLQQQGIDPSLLSSVAYGEYKPVASNDTPEGKAKNRRIEIVLVPKD